MPKNEEIYEQSIARITCEADIRSLISAAVDSVRSGSGNVYLTADELKNIVRIFIKQEYPYARINVFTVQGGIRVSVSWQGCWTGVVFTDMTLEEPVEMHIVEEREYEVEDYEDEELIDEEYDEFDPSVEGEYDRLQRLMREAVYDLGNEPPDTVYGYYDTKVKDRIRQNICFLYPYARISVVPSSMGHTPYITVSIIYRGRTVEGIYDLECVRYGTMVHPGGRVTVGDPVIVEPNFMEVPASAIYMPLPEPELRSQRPRPRHRQDRTTDTRKQDMDDFKAWQAEKKRQKAIKPESEYKRNIRIIRPGASKG